MQILSTKIITLLLCLIGICLAVINTKEDVVQEEATIGNETTTKVDNIKMLPYVLEKSKDVKNINNKKLYNILTANVEDIDAEQDSFKSDSTQINEEDMIWQRIHHQLPQHKYVNYIHDSKPPYAHSYADSYAAGVYELSGLADKPQYGGMADGMKAAVQAPLLLAVNVGLLTCILSIVLTALNRLLGGLGTSVNYATPFKGFYKNNHENAANSMFKSI